ncbi:MAG: peptidyl-tRNA hydrolase Pth2 [Candidatus Micrarchaeia archaeon]
MKQVIVVRDDLRLGKGKLAAHVAHAALEGYRLVMKKNPNIVREWEEAGEKKIVVRVPNLASMLSLFEQAKATLPCALIKDAGLTQIPKGTITCLVLGPWYSEAIDKFTKDLKLL